MVHNWLRTLSSIELLDYLESDKIEHDDIIIGNYKDKMLLEEDDFFNSKNFDLNTRNSQLEEFAFCRDNVILLAERDFS